MDDIKLMFRLNRFFLGVFIIAALSVQGKVVVYPEYDVRIERDYAYAVKVIQGDNCRDVTVYNHCEKSTLIKRTKGGDVNRRFCEFAFDEGPVRVDVSVCEDVQSYSVFPSRLMLRNTFSNGVISVWLDKPTNFGIRINDYDKTILSVFADAPEDVAKVPKKGDEHVLFVEGWVDAPGDEGVLVVDESVKEVYIAPGSVLNSRLIVKSKGAYLHGRGMVLDPFSDVFRYDQRKNTRRGVLRVEAPDVLVEDIKLVDARTFNFMSRNTNIIFRNIKALSSMMCSDGVTCGGSDFRVEGAWLYVGDNAFVISGVKGAFIRDVVAGTSCNAVFPQGSNTDVFFENLDVFRADEGLIKNVYNGVLRRNTKWNEMNSGMARKEPGPQDLVHQRQGFSFRNLSAVDCVLFSHFFVGGNMGSLPKTFGFENVSVPYPTGKDDWRTIGQKDGAIVDILHNSRRWLDSTGYVLSFTNLWIGGSRFDAIPLMSVKNADRVSISVNNTSETSSIPIIANRCNVDWNCTFKRFIGSSLQRDARKVSRDKGEQKIEQLNDGENLLADRPSTRSSWQRYPSWLVKFDAMGMDGGSRVYRLTQCEKMAGIVNVFTDAFLRHGNGRYRLSFEARVCGDSAVPVSARFLSNDQFAEVAFNVPNSGQWGKYEADMEIRFDIPKTELAALRIVSKVPVDEMCFKNLSLVKVAE